MSDAYEDIYAHLDEARRIAKHNFAAYESVRAKRDALRLDLKVCSSTRKRAEQAAREFALENKGLQAKLEECEGHLNPPPPDPDPPVVVPPDPDPPVTPPNGDLADVFAMSIDDLKERARRHRVHPPRPRSAPVPRGLLSPGSDGWARVRDVTFKPTWKWAMNAPVRGSLSAPAQSVRIANCGLNPHALADPYTMYWFARLHHLDNMEVLTTDCVGRKDWLEEDRDPVASGVQPALRVIPKEHWLYASVAGDSHVRDCYVQDIGGQALQVVNRAFSYGQYAGDNSVKNRATTHTVQRLGVVNAGYDGSRGAFAASYFDPGTPLNPCRIVLTDVDFIVQWERWRQQNDWVWYESRAQVPNQQKARQSEGLLVVHNFDAEEIVAREGVKGPTTDELIVTRGTFARGFSGQPLANLDGIRRIVFRECVFKQPPGSATMNIDPHAHIRELLGMVEEVRFEDCYAENVEVRIHHDTGVAVRNPHCPGSESVYRR